MQKDCLTLDINGDKRNVTCFSLHTLVIGSGAAGLNAAVQLYRRGIEHICIITEGLKMGTSINTGSDKQTYYKVSLSGSADDSVVEAARSLFDGGSMHGDLALVESALSLKAFFNLDLLGVPFPHDKYGQYFGYKTDHDPRSRATSIGPYTSKEMCLRLIDEVKRIGIDIHEKRYAAALLTVDEGESKRAAGAVVWNAEAGSLEIYKAENVVFATGGPGGLYERSVYPNVHLGGIGLALEVGAAAQSLPESQFGLASTKFRWNVSGTYMQVVPRLISTAADGVSDEREFLPEWFTSHADAHSKLFLKGYQWPFDPEKVQNGSSIIDILVHRETAILGRRVFLDYRTNPKNYELEKLSPEARDYLTKSGATQDTPFGRLAHMNMQAVELYRDHGIDIEHEPLEVAVCAQHNNGGLAADHWWQSLNVTHLFPVGEVNGSHGVRRPGGTALNSGQVGAIRAAEFIGARYKSCPVEKEPFEKEAAEKLSYLQSFLQKSKDAKYSAKDELLELQKRMSLTGSQIREAAAIAKALEESKEQMQRITNEGCCFSNENPREAAIALQVRQLAISQEVYLSAIKFQIESKTGSRGSALVLSPDGEIIHDRLEDNWRMIPEEEDYRKKVLLSLPQPDNILHQWVERRPLPEEDNWFETEWRKFRTGEIYK